MTNYIYCGKQVLHGRSHVADCCDEPTAMLIASALNERRQSLCDQISIAAKSETVHSRQTTCHVRREGDEYACLCGARWEVRAGDEHP